MVRAKRLHPAGTSAFVFRCLPARHLGSVDRSPTGRPARSPASGPHAAPVGRAVPVHPSPG